MRSKLLLFCFLILSSLVVCSSYKIIDHGNLNRQGEQWVPYVEWSLYNPSVYGNPFDLVAWVTFTHEESKEVRKTQMFYNGDSVWKFRFTGTLPGKWLFITSSNHPNLDGLKGTVDIRANFDPKARGFLTNYGNKWIWMEGEEAFLPQLIMYRTPKYFYNQPDKIDADIQTWLNEHGFSGFHVRVYHAWFDIWISEGGKSSGSYSELTTKTANPDFRTFEALELLIKKVYEAGGIVHIWKWGDETRRQSPHGLKDGINGVVDKRLQRYIAARLGPIPGWTMGYGYDNWEWNDKEIQEEWYTYMHQHFGWPHMLGARWEKNRLSQATEMLDYASYEQHKPDYSKYVQTIGARPDKPAFSEDRFRIRGEVKRPKDYSLQETRRGLWYSTLAGGVANIWGNQIKPDGSIGWDEGGSNPYPNKHQIKTYSNFFSGRFLKDMQRANQLTDGYALKNSSNNRFIFYKENTSSIFMDLSGMKGVQPAIAVDTKNKYKEISISSGLGSIEQIWKAPYVSDWAVAVGTFAKN